MNETEHFIHAEAGLTLWRDKERVYRLHLEGNTHAVEVGRPASLAAGIRLMQRASRNPRLIEDLRRFAA